MTVVFRSVLSEKGIMPGIRLDIGQEEIPGFGGEQLSFGLDDIRKRLAEFKSLGAVLPNGGRFILSAKGNPVERR